MPTARMNASPPPAAVRRRLAGAHLIRIRRGAHLPARRRPDQRALVHHAVPRRGAHQGRRPVTRQRALTVLPRLGFQVIVSAPESKTGEILEVSTKAYVTYKDPDTGLTSLREAVLHQNDMDDESSSDILKDDGVAE